MPNQEPEIIDLTSTPPSPEIIVIDSSSDDEPPIRPAADITPPPKRKKSKSPKEAEHALTVVAKDSVRLKDGAETSTLEAKDNRESRQTKKRRRNGQSREGSTSGRRRSRSLDYRPTRNASPTRLHRRNGSELFFVDANPSRVTTSPSRQLSKVMSVASQDHDAEEPAKLLLPAHVSVLDTGASTGEVPIKILRPSESANIEEYIEYLDYDDIKAVGAGRYFDQEAVENKKPKIVCKNCGAAGEHKTIDCPIQICLTCGARDDHSTRGCPIGKTCYTCGMKGHITRTCPNRYTLAAKDHRDVRDCDRCGSDIHKTNECPTLWRLYDYHTVDERDSVLRTREAKRRLGLGHGGEGYIATDDWCYNCGQRGHWGDDCIELPRAQHAPNEPSAFGLHNLTSGPFVAVSPRLAPSSPNHKREPRDWEREDVIVDKWGYHAPAHVGKQARKKERAKMERRAREQNVEEEDEDWFGRSDKGPRNRKRSDSQERQGGPSGRIKLSLGLSLPGTDRSNVPPTQPRSERSLRDRLSGEFDRPPPTHPRGRRRSNSLLERLGHQMDYGGDERSSYSKDWHKSPSSYKPWSKGSVEERSYERDKKWKPLAAEEQGSRYM